MVLSPPLLAISLARPAPPAPTHSRFKRRTTPRRIGLPAATFSVQIQPLLAITSTNLSDTTVGANYVDSLTATGGNTPYTWSVGSLPSGLTLKADGTLSGIPLAATASTFIVQVTDATQPAQSTSRTFTLNVTLGLTVATNALPDGYINISPATRSPTTHPCFFQSLLTLAKWDETSRSAQELDQWKPGSCTPECRRLLETLPRPAPAAEPTNATDPDNEPQPRLLLCAIGIASVSD